MAISPPGSCLGFFSQAYWEHDYFLGRRNAPRFLRWVFVLPRSNHAVFGTGDRFRGDSERALGRAERRRLGVAHADHPALRRPAGAHRRGGRDGRQPLPAWPIRTFDPEEIKLLLEQRVGVVLPLPLPRDMPLTPLGPKDFKGTLMRQILKLITPDVSGRIAEFAMTKVRAGVRTVDAGAT